MGTVNLCTDQSGSKDTNRMKTILIVAILLLVATTWADPDTDEPYIFFEQLHTTFRALSKSDVQPMDMDAKGFSKLNGCNDSTTYAGYRYVQDAGTGNPTMVIIYDETAYEAAGIQSLVPSNTFVGYDCSINEFYTKETINGVEFCIITAYFKDPSTLCIDQGDHYVPNQLYFQIGDSFAPENLVKAPKTWKEAEDNQDFWKLSRFFPGMGHHITRNEHGSHDCKSYMPFQVLYAYRDGHCVNTGLVFQHFNTNVKDNRSNKKSDAWEAPPGTAVKIIIKDPDQCQVESADKGLVKTMHAFLGGSVTYCFTD